MHFEEQFLAEPTHTSHLMSVFCKNDIVSHFTHKYTHIYAYSPVQSGSVRFNRSKTVKRVQPKNAVQCMNISNETKNENYIIAFCLFVDLMAKTKIYTAHTKGAKYINERNQRPKYKLYT